MRSFQFRSILYIERCAYIVLEHLSNAFSNFKYLAARHGMFEPTKNLFSRYVSTFGSKRRYHSSWVCVDVAGRDSCRLQQYDQLLEVVGSLYTDVGKTTMSNFCLVGPARTVLLVASYSRRIFPRRNFSSRRRK